jgi:hypothetical protein
MHEMDNFNITDSLPKSLSWLCDCLAALSTNFPNHWLTGFRYIDVINEPEIWWSHDNSSQYHNWLP